MIYKVLYQADKTQSPRREATESLYLEAKSAVEARQLVEDNTPYNIEFVQELIVATTTTKPSSESILRSRKTTLPIHYPLTK